MGRKYNHPHLQHHHHHQEEEQQKRKQQRSKLYLPMLCSSSSSSSNKQVIIKLSLSHQRRCSSPSSSSSISDDPLSPRVGCMGQVKKNNKVVGFPSIISFTTTPFTTTTTTTSNNNTLKSDQNSYNSNMSIVKYHKLKRFFSSKSLANSPTAAASPAATHKAKGTSERKNNTYNNNNARSAVCSSSSKGMRASIGGGHRGMICRSKNIIDKNNEADDVKGSLVNLVEMDPPLPVVKRQGNDGESTAVSLWKRRSGGAPLKTLQVQVIHQIQNQAPILLPASTV